MPTTEENKAVCWIVCWEDVGQKGVRECLPEVLMQIHDRRPPVNDAY